MAVLQYFFHMDPNLSPLERLLALQGLTPSEARVADVILHSYREVVFDNVTTLSRRADVSKATIVRFFAKLGYDRSGEFFRHLKREVTRNETSPEQRYRLQRERLLQEGEEDLLGRNFEAIIRNLQHTHARVDPAVFTEIARRIADGDRRLYVLGQRTSHALAYLFHVLVSAIRPRVTLLGGADPILPDTLAEIGPDSLLFVISYRRYARLTQRAAEVFAECGAPVILLTDSAFSPLAGIARWQLVVPSEGLSIFQSFCSATALLESLILAALPFCGDELKQRFERRERLFARFETFGGRNGPGGPARRAMKTRWGEIDRERKRMKNDGEEPGGRAS
jgi:DNA-binding MurR/RpiR family transcriptional regulator